MISVIIPTYNSEKTIGNCLEALREQTTKNFEVIIVDDGSKDGTKNAVKSYKGIKFFKQEHKGPAAARDLGAKMAKGDILLFTDSDCVPDKNWIAEMTEPFDNDKNVVGVSGTYRTRQKEIIARFAQYEIEERHEKMINKPIDFIGTFSAGYRKKIFDEFGGFDTSFSTSAGEDPELSFRIAEKGYKMVFAPKAIVYHTHPDTIWKYLKQKFRNSYWRVSVYAKRKKTFSTGHSYTPKSVLWEAVAAAWVLIMGTLILIFSFPYPLLIIGVLLTATFLSSYSLIVKILKKDFIVGLWSPIIIITRAFTTALGISLGILRRLSK